MGFGKDGFHRGTFTKTVEAFLESEEAVPAEEEGEFAGCGFGWVNDDGDVGDSYQSAIGIGTIWSGRARVAQQSSQRL